MSIMESLNRINKALDRNIELTDIKAKEILKQSTNGERKKNGKSDTKSDTLELCELDDDEKIRGDAQCQATRK